MTIAADRRPASSQTASPSTVGAAIAGHHWNRVSAAAARRRRRRRRRPRAAPPPPLSGVRSAGQTGRRTPRASACARTAARAGARTAHARTLRTPEAMARRKGACGRALQSSRVCPCACGAAGGRGPAASKSFSASSRTLPHASCTSPRTHHVPSRTVDRASSRPSLCIGAPHIMPRPPWLQLLGACSRLRAMLSLSARRHHI